MLGGRKVRGRRRRGHGMHWTPQDHYRTSADQQVQDQRKGYWENGPPEPDPEPEPAGPDAAKWKTSNVTVAAAEAEAAAATLKVHAELSSRLEAADLLEAADGAESIVWTLPGFEQTVGAGRPAGVCIRFTHQTHQRSCG